ncbi:hypothetical protein ACFL6U_04595 [Planctomycetota bacterium]
MRRTTVCLVGCTAIIVFVVVQVAHASNKSNNSTISDTIIALEKAALDRWNNGDTSGYLEIYAKEITYFDETTPARLEWYPPYRKYVLGDR